MAKKTSRKKTAQKKESYPQQELVDKIIGMFEQSWDYATGSWHQRWEDNYNLYNGERVKRGYEGITDTFVPMVFSTVEMMTSALFGTKPKFTYTPPKEKPDQNTDILNSLLDSFWDKDQWSLKFINWGRDFIRLGTSIIYIYWDGNCPRIVNIPIRDFIIDPTANSMETARFKGRRYLTTKEELESFEIVDLEKSTEEETVMKPKYKDLDKLGIYNSDKTTDKEIKDMWYGSTIDKSEDNQVEVIEIWYYDTEKQEDRVVSVGNRCVVIEDTENWYKSKARENGEEYPQAIDPFVALRDYVDGSLFYAKGEVDFLADQQELLNDLTNQNIDSITYTLNQMYTLDPKYEDMIDEVENLPGAVYPFEAGALNPVNRGNVPADAFNERLNIKNEMRETSASNEIVKGVGQEGGKVTATEIQAQIAGAGQRMGLKVTQVEDEGFHRLAQIVFAMVRLYINEKMLVRIVGKDGVRWEEFDPEEFKEGEYDPRAQLETTVNSEKQQQGEMAKEMMGAFLNDPQINQSELKKLVLQRSFDLDPDEVQLLMTPEGMEAGIDGVSEGEETQGEQPLESQSIEQPLQPEQPIDGAQVIDAIIDPVTGELVPADPVIAEQMAMAQAGVL